MESRQWIFVFWTTQNSSEWIRKRPFSSRYLKSFSARRSRVFLDRAREDTESIPKRPFWEKIHGCVVTQSIPKLIYYERTLCLKFSRRFSVRSLFGGRRKPREGIPVGVNGPTISRKISQRRDATVDTIHTNERKILSWLSFETCDNTFLEIRVQKLKPHITTYSKK